MNILAKKRMLLRVDMQRSLYQQGHPRFKQKDIDEIYKNLLINLDEYKEYYNRNLGAFTPGQKESMEYLIKNTIIRYF
jgi:hypothetical protein